MGRTRVTPFPSKSAWAQPHSKHWSPLCWRDSERRSMVPLCARSSPALVTVPRCGPASRKYQFTGASAQDVPLRRSHRKWWGVLAASVRLRVGRRPIASAFGQAEGRMTPPATAQAAGPRVVRLTDYFADLPDFPEPVSGLTTHDSFLKHFQGRVRRWHSPGFGSRGAPLSQHWVPDASSCLFASSCLLSIQATLFRPF